MSKRSWLVGLWLLCGAASPVWGEAPLKVQLVTGNAFSSTPVYRALLGYLRRRGLLSSSERATPLRLRWLSERSFELKCLGKVKGYTLPAEAQSVRVKARTMALMIELFIEGIRKQSQPPPPPRRARTSPPRPRPKVRSRPQPRSRAPARRRAAPRLVPKRAIPKPRLPRPRPPARRPPARRPPARRPPVARRPILPRRQPLSRRARPPARPRARPPLWSLLRWKAGFAVVNEWGIDVPDRPFLGGSVFAALSLGPGWWLQATGSVAGQLGQSEGAAHIQTALTVGWEPYHSRYFISELFAGVVHSGRWIGPTARSVQALGLRAGFQVALRPSPLWSLYLAVPFQYLPLRFGDAPGQVEYPAWDFQPQLGFQFHYPRKGPLAARFEARRWRAGAAPYLQFDIETGDPLLGLSLSLATNLLPGAWLQLSTSLGFIAGDARGILDLQLALTLHWQLLRIAWFGFELFAGIATSLYIDLLAERRLFGFGPRAGPKWIFQLSPLVSLFLSVHFSWYGLQAVRGFDPAKYGDWTFQNNLGIHIHF